MNAPERKVVYLAFCLFILGVVFRLLPWGLPSIENFQVGDRLIVANELQTDTIVLNKVEPKDVTSKLEKRPSEEKVPKIRKKAPPKVSLPIPINSANLDMLCALKGVGPKLAEKILAYREAHGPFKNEKDLKKVPGIGPKKLEGLLPGVIFD